MKRERDKTVVDVQFIPLTRERIKDVIRPLLKYYPPLRKQDIVGCALIHLIRNSLPSVFNPDVYVQPVRMFYIYNFIAAVPDELEDADFLPKFVDVLYRNAPELVEDSFKNWFESVATPLFKQRLPEDKLDDRLRLLKKLFFYNWLPKLRAEEARRDMLKAICLYNATKSVPKSKKIPIPKNEEDRDALCAEIAQYLWLEPELNPDFNYYRIVTYQKDGTCRLNSKAVKDIIRKHADQFRSVFQNIKPHGKEFDHKLESDPHAEAELNEIIDTIKTIAEQRENQGTRSAAKKVIRQHFIDLVITRTLTLTDLANKQGLDKGNLSKALKQEISYYMNHSALKAYKNELRLMLCA